MEEPIDIRILTADEAHLLSRVASGVFDGAVRESSLHAFFASGRHHIAAALHDGLVAGMATGFDYVHPDKAPEFFIIEAGVADGWRNRGLGRRLVTALVEHARGLGCSAAWVLTEEGNRPARRLYAATGGREQPGVVMSLFEFE